MAVGGNKQGLYGLERAFLVKGVGRGGGGGSRGGERGWLRGRREQQPWVDYKSVVRCDADEPYGARREWRASWARPG